MHARAVTHGPTGLAYSINLIKKSAHASHLRHPAPPVRPPHPALRHNFGCSVYPCSALVILLANASAVSLCICAATSSRCEHTASAFPSVLSLLIGKLGTAYGVRMQEGMVSTQKGP